MILCFSVCPAFTISPRTALKKKQTLILKWQNQGKSEKRQPNKTETKLDISRERERDVAIHK